MQDAARCVGYHPGMSVRIDRCVCTGRLFCDLVRQAKQENKTIEQIMLESRAGHGCALCRPYLREAMATGRMIFTEVISE